MATAASPRTARPRPPKLGRPKGQFTAHRKLDKLRELLEHHQAGLTLEEMARTLRVSQRSVRRYLKELEMTTELESLETTPGAAHLWRIKPSERARTVALRRTQAYGLLALRRVLDVLRGTALFDELDIAFDEVLKIAQRPTRVTAKGEVSGEHRLEERFYYVPSSPYTLDKRAEDLDELFTAVADLRVTEIRARSRGGKARRDRFAFHPYALLIHDGSLVVVGRTVATGQLEALRVDGLSEVRASERERFELPSDFDAEQWLQGAFGVGAPSSERVLVEFSPDAAKEIVARRWHPQQRMATATDGRVRLSIPLSNREQLVRWVLSFADGARVIEPEDIAAEVRQRFERAAARYA